jgi:deoxyribose-phosphate aldolase
MSKEVAKHIELWAAQPDATTEQIRKACELAASLGCYGVCVNGSRVELAASLLENSDLKLTALIGYPFGAADTDVKRFETETAIDFGAQEIEFVINAGLLKDGNLERLLREMRDVTEAAEERQVKIAVEAGVLAAEELKAVAGLALDSGAHFICLGTGIGIGAPPSPAIVASLREVVGQKFGIKVSGPISSLAEAEALLSAGATRLGAPPRSGLIQALSPAKS